LVVNFRRSVIIEELWRPEVARPGNYVSNFCVFFGKTTPYGKILKNVKQVFTASPIDDVVFICHKIYPTAKCANRAASQTVATARIAHKICQGQPPTMYSQCSKFHQNPFTFGGVIAELVNTVFVPYSVSIIRSKLCFASGK